MKKVLIIILALFVSNASYAADSSFQQLSKGNPTKSCLQYNEAGTALQGASTSNINLGDGTVGTNIYTGKYFKTSSSGHGTQTIEHVSSNWDDSGVTGKITNASSSLSTYTVTAGENLVANFYFTSGQVAETLDAGTTYSRVETVKCTITP
jgi:hypothetical protein